MFDSTSTELKQYDEQLNPILEKAKDQSLQTQQLALDATRLFSCTEKRLNDYSDKGFFKRCWYFLYGKTGEVQRANQSDLVEMQKIGWRYLNLLNERDLMNANSIVTVKNNLLTLAVQEEETRKAVADMADKISERMEKFESRLKEVETTTDIHSWLWTLDTSEVYERLPPKMRLLRVVRDFYSLKSSHWSLQEVRLLQKGVAEAGLESRKKITLQAFLNDLIDELGTVSFNKYTSLVYLPQNGNNKMIPASFVLENIAAPSYTAMIRIGEDYTGSSATIKALQDKLDTSVHEALKVALMTFIQNEGIDTTVAIPLRDLAVELLTCLGLTSGLYAESHKSNRSLASRAKIWSRE